MAAFFVIIAFLALILAAFFMAIAFLAACFMTIAFLALILAGMMLHRHWKQKKRRDRFYRRRKRSLARTLAWSLFMGRKPLRLKQRNEEKNI